MIISDIQVIDATNLEQAQNELCECKHTQSFHIGQQKHINDKTYLIPFHGACRIAECSCSKYRWASFIDEQLAKELAQKAREGYSEEIRTMNIDDIKIVPDLPLH
jgi:hypothetical protein